MQARLLNVASEHPGDWRDVTVPGPLGFLRVAVLARSLDDIPRFRIDLRLMEDRLVSSGNGGRPERMNQGAAAMTAATPTAMRTRLSILFSLLTYPTVAANRQ